MLCAESAAGQHGAAGQRRGEAALGGREGEAGGQDQGAPGGRNITPSHPFNSAANRLIGEVVQSRRRPLLGPSPG